MQCVNLDYPPPLLLAACALANTHTQKRARAIQHEQSRINQHYSALPPLPVLPPLALVGRERATFSVNANKKSPAQNAHFRPPPIKGERASAGGGG